MKKKNDTKNEYIESGLNVFKKIAKTNDYIELINNKRKIKYIYNHKARYNNLRDIEILKNYHKEQTQLTLQSKILCPIKIDQKFLKINIINYQIIKFVRQLLRI